MRKFTMIFAALLIGSVCFAQKTLTNSEMFRTTLPQNSTERSAWYGNLWGSNVIGITANHQVIIRTEQFSQGTPGNTVTKVKFETANPANVTGTTAYANYTNMSFTVKIYEGGTIENDLLTSGEVLYDASMLGTEVYSQNYTQTTYGENEVILTTPYTINTNSYWISIVCNGNTLFANNRIKIRFPYVN